MHLDVSYWPVAYGRVCTRNKLLASKIGVMSVTEEPKKSTRLPRQARRAQLLEAARVVFVREGFHAAGMDDIAEKAGVSKPVLYQHFPSKRELYMALLDAGKEELIDSVTEALSSTENNHERVQASVSAYFAFVNDDSKSFRLIFESDLYNEAAVRQRLQEADEACAMELMKVITQDTGTSEEEANLLAYGLIGMAQTAARRWLRTGRSVPNDQAVDLIARLAWQGISSVPLSTRI